MNMEITGLATAKAMVHNAGELREFVKWMDKHKVADWRELDTDGGIIYLDLVDTQKGDVGSMTECGDHVSPVVMFDVLLETHKHVNDYPANYEEALEDALPVDIPQFDWITRDRYNDPGMPE